MVPYIDKADSLKWGGASDRSRVRGDKMMNNESGIDAITLTGPYLMIEYAQHFQVP